MKRLIVPISCGFLMTVAVAVLLSDATSQQFTTPIKNPRLELAEKIQETADYFGRHRLIGKVVNKEKVRIDFIRIEVTLKNRVGEVIGTASQFIKGKTYRFYDFVVSTSSLEPEQTGTFDLIANVPADSVYSYTYDITGTHFIFR